MRFIRRRRDVIERAWISDKHTAEELGRALSVLGQNVILVRHPYKRHPHSGAGNCWCGREERNTIHQVVLEP